MKPENGNISGHGGSPVRLSAAARSTGVSRASCANRTGAISYPVPYQRCWTTSLSFDPTFEATEGNHEGKKDDAMSVSPHCFFFLLQSTKKH